MNYTQEYLDIIEEFKNGTQNFAVRARAGCGKTTICEKGLPLAPEEKVAYVVFGKKNQLEAKARITDPKVKILTLNGLGFAYIKRQWDQAIPDEKLEWERLAKAGGKMPQDILKNLHKAVELTKAIAPWARDQDISNIILSRSLSPNKLLQKAGWTVDRMVEIVQKTLEASKKKDPRNRISFTDQVWLPVVMGWVQPWYKLLVVDEFQDTNNCQRNMLKKAVQKSGRTVIIGDDMQAIFQFRGADVDSIDDFAAELKAKVFPLTYTYRCPQKVVALAMQIVPDFKACESNVEGEIKNEALENVYTLAKAGDAVISRKNAPLVDLCVQFLKKGISARIEGKDVASGLSSLIKSLKPSNLEDLKAKVTQWATAKTHRLYQNNAENSAIEMVLDQAETVRSIANSSSSLDNLELKLKNFFADDVQESGRHVILTSTHKAKGLEYDNVFLITDTYTKDFSTKRCEVNCLKYVAITRAKKTLTWLV